MAMLVSDQVRPAGGWKITISVKVGKVRVTVTIGNERKRRDIAGLPPPGIQPLSKCGDQLKLTRFSAATIRKMDGKDFDVEIERFHDPNGYPVYDVIKLISRNPTSGDKVEAYYLTTITDECDCTSILKPGEFVIEGDQQDGEFIHGYMMAAEKYGKKQEVDRIVIGAVVGAVAVFLVLVIVIASVFMRRRQRSMKGNDAVVAAGVNNEGCEVKTVVP